LPFSLFPDPPGLSGSSITMKLNGSYLWSQFCVLGMLAFSFLDRAWGAEAEASGSAAATGHAASSLAPGRMFTENATAASTHAPAAGLGSLFQAMFALVVVVALIVGLAWVVRRLGWQPRSVQSPMQVRGAISVGQRQRILLLEVAGECLVVGVTPQQISTLHRFPVADLHAASTQAPDARQFSQAFSTRLREMLNKRS